MDMLEKNDCIGTLEKKLRAHLFSAEVIFPGMISNAYSGPFKEIVHGQGWDFASTFGLYHMITIPETIFFPRNSKIAKAASVFGLASLLEIGQYYGLYPGTFDPKDFLAYAAGVLAALGLEKIIDYKLKFSTSEISKEYPQSMELSDNF